MNEQLEILNRGKKEEVKDLLIKRYNIKIDIPHHLIKPAKNKLRIFTGDLNSQDMLILNALLKVETVGLYFASLEDGLRLGYDAAMLYAKKADKNTIILNKEEAKKWLQGHDLEKASQGEEGFVVVKHDNDILGVGKATGKKLLNFVPKERRVFI
jgi:NOL1/NOP2/fmu family ribosome biogenesis protein